MTLPPTSQSRFADFGLPELSADTVKRIGFTLGALVIWRLGNFLPLPGVSLDTFAQLLKQQPGTFLFVSDAVARVSVFSLGVSPYVGSYVLLHVLCAFSERLRDLRRAGPLGWQRFSHLIRAGALLIAIFQSYRFAIGLEAVPNLILQPGFFFRASTVLSLVAGTMFLIWLGEQISKRGVGSGVWLIVAASYVVELPAAIFAITNAVAIAAVPGWVMGASFALAVGLIALVVLVEAAERRLPVEYTGDMRSSPISFLSLKIDNTGVLAPLVASALVLMVPSMLAALLEPGGMLEPGGPGWATNIARAMARGQPLFFLSYAALIILFVFFFTAVTIDNRQLAMELGQNGGKFAEMAEGERPAELLDGILTRLSLIGALYLVVLCVVPEILINYGAPFYLGGVSLLVTALVAIGVFSDVATPVSRSRSIGSDRAMRSLR
jgi:preprotein translocase subunit SecY